MSHWYSHKHILGTVCCFPLPLTWRWLRNWWLEYVLCSLLRVLFTFKSFDLCFLEKSNFIRTIFLCLSQYIIAVINMTIQSGTRACNCNPFSSGPLPSKTVNKRKHFAPCAYGCWTLEVCSSRWRRRAVCWVVPGWGSGDPEPCASVFSQVLKHPVMPFLSIIFLQI